MSRQLIRGSLLDVVEAAYVAEPSDAQWIQGIINALAPKMNQGLGLFGWLYDAPRLDQIKVFHPTVLGMGDGVLEHVLASASHPETRADFRERHYQTPAGCISDQLAADYPDYAPFAQHLYPNGIRDILTVNALDIDGKGVAINALMPEQGVLSPVELENLERLSAHLVSAYRLRRQSRGEEANAAAGVNVEAIFDGQGKIQHVEPGATAAARDGTLSHAASMIDQARGKLRQAKPEQALEIWQALVAGRWSLVDFVDSDGKRFLVAKVNEPQARTRRPLSERERQIAGFVRRGHSNKLIAYDLGLSESTVASHVSNALQKLGLTSRVELARLLLQEENEIEGVRE